MGIGASVADQRKWTTYRQFTGLTSQRKAGLCNDGDLAASRLLRRQLVEAHDQLLQVEVDYTETRTRIALSTARRTEARGMDVRKATQDATNGMHETDKQNRTVRNSGI